MINGAPGCLLAAVALAASCGDAIAAQRWPQGPAATEAVERGDLTAAGVALKAELQACEATKPTADECLGLLMGIGAVAMMRGAVGEGITFTHRAMLLAEVTLPSGHADTMRIYGNLAVMFETLGQYGQAEPLHRKLVALRDATGAPLELRMRTTHALARNLEAQGRYPEAEQFYRRVVDILTVPPTGQTEHLAIAYDNLAGILDTLRRYPESESLRVKSAAILEAQRPPNLRALGTFYSNWGAGLARKSRLTEAEAMLRRALTYMQRAFPDDVLQVAPTYINLANILSGQRKLNEAEAVMRECVAQIEALVANGKFNALASDTNVTVAKTVTLSFGTLVDVLSAQSRQAEGLHYLRRSVAILETTLPPRHPDLSDAYSQLAAVLAGRGLAGEAELLFRKTLAIRLAALGDRHPHTAAALNDLAMLLHNRGRRDEAFDMFRRAMLICEAALPPGDPRLAAAYKNYAHALIWKDRLVEAEGYFRKALEISRRSDAHDPREVSGAYFALAAILQLQGKAPAETRTLYRLAAAQLDKAMALHRDFSSAAMAELQNNRILFRGQVKAAWQLGAGAR